MPKTIILLLDICFVVVRVYWHYGFYMHPKLRLWQPSCFIDFNIVSLYVELNASKHCMYFVSMTVLAMSVFMCNLKETVANQFYFHLDVLRHVFVIHGYWRV